MKVTGLDHVVLLVADLERSLAWYCGVLGLTPERVDEWRAGMAPFPSARIDATTILDFMPRPPGEGANNVDHVCLVVEPTDFDAVVTAGDLEVVSGPGPRWGAQGDATSIYVLDPDGNVIELRHY
jgi:catechol 2,3-dioxygenase-like lactoylglutathione lyase family enzyme